MINQDFEQFFQANERRIHYQIHKLKIRGNWYSGFYTEGIFALWQAYRDFDPTKGNPGTYLNYRIRYRLIDLIRKKKREMESEKKVIEQRVTDITNGNRIRHSNTLLLNKSCLPHTDDQFWHDIRNQLTDNQWKWVKYFIIADMSIQEIMEIENVTADAVKGWGQAVRKKLRNENVRQALDDIIKE